MKTSRLKLGTAANGCDQAAMIRLRKPARRVAMMKKAKPGYSHRHILPGRGITSRGSADRRRARHGIGSSPLYRHKVTGLHQALSAPEARDDVNRRWNGTPYRRANWRAKFKAEPQPPARKLLYRRRGVSLSLSHPQSHTPSHSLSHATYPSFAPSPGPIVLPARAGHRRRFSEADRLHILAEAAEPGASVSEVARR